MADLQMPMACQHCAAEDGPHYEAHQGLVQLRYEWTGLHKDNGQPVVKVEAPAGTIPSPVRFPHVNLVPSAAWCPCCRTLFRIGPPHPADEDAFKAANEEPGPTIVNGS